MHVSIDTHYYPDFTTALLVCISDYLLMKRPLRNVKGVLRESEKVQGRTQKAES